MMKIINQTFSFLICIILIFLSCAPSAAQSLPSNKAAAKKPFSFPPQMEMHVLFDPTSFPSGQKSFLIYELYLTNFSTSAISLLGIELRDTNNENSSPIVSFDALELHNMVKILGVEDSKDNLTIGGGQSAIVFIEARLNSSLSFPEKITHRIITGNDSLDGAVMVTHKTNLKTLSPPVKGTDWIAADGPGNSVDNHHRRGVIILNGRAVNSRRFAIDWKKVKDSLSFSGNPRDVHSYFCYGDQVFAVADGKVIAANDGLPDNIPGHGKEFHPAVPLTFEQLAGNKIVIDLGNGQYAHYMHLQPGSVRVKAGDHVRKGDILGKIGNSGDAREPHLHFEVTTSPMLLKGEGLPYLIDHYRLGFQQGFNDIHKNELPKEKEIVAFIK
ncbi:M23 family metallopeptidase [Pedobacter sp. WC2501]|uniref:M23 family metallopeptidase n=1 Tax=Pedobacter sp. WC2501 TaxID=3461400 RepID=UPI004046451D